MKAEVLRKRIVEALSCVSFYFPGPNQRTTGPDKRSSSLTKEDGVIAVLRRLWLPDYGGQLSSRLRTGILAHVLWLECSNLILPVILHNTTQ
jgi:hypothetical protein